MRLRFKYREGRDLKNGMVKYREGRDLKKGMVKYREGRMPYHAVQGRS